MGNFSPIKFFFQWGLKNCLKVRDGTHKTFYERVNSNIQPVLTFTGNAGAYLSVAPWVTPLVRWLYANSHSVACFYVDCHLGCILIKRALMSHVVEIAFLYKSPYKWHLRRTLSHSVCLSGASLACQEPHETLEPFL